MSRKLKYEDSMRSHSINGGLDNINQNFSSECDDIEVEAIFVLVSLESETEMHVYKDHSPQLF